MNLDESFHSSIKPARRRIMNPHRVDSELDDEEVVESFEYIPLEILNL